MPCTGSIPAPVAQSGPFQGWGAQSPLRLAAAGGACGDVATMVMCAAAPPVLWGASGCLGSASWLATPTITNKQALSVIAEPRTAAGLVLSGYWVGIELAPPTPKWDV